MKTLLLFTLIALFPLMVHADEGDEGVAAEDVVLERDLAAGRATNALRLRVHKAGHLEGKPFVIEIAEACAGGEQIIDSHSVCDVAPNTAAYRPETSELEMLVRDPNANASGCQLKAKKVVFRLQSHCGR